MPDDPILILTGDPDRRTNPPGWFSEWKDARVEDAARLDRLERATEALAANASALSTALSTYATKGDVEVVERKAQSKEEAAAQHETELKATRLARRDTAARITGVAIIFFIVFVSALLGAVNYLQGKGASAFQVCEQRNSDAAALRNFIQHAVENAATGPETPQQVANTHLIMILAQADKPVNCGGLK